MDDFEVKAWHNLVGKKVKNDSGEVYTVIAFATEPSIDLENENGERISFCVGSFMSKGWEIYEEGYYECLYCHGSLEEKDMGLRCKHCDEWTYYKDCFKKGKKPEPKESLSDLVFDRNAQRVYKERNVKEKIQNVQRRLKEWIKRDELFDEKSLLEKIDKIFKEEFGEKLVGDKSV